LEGRDLSSQLVPKLSRAHPVFYTIWYWERKQSERGANYSPSATANERVFKLWLCEHVYKSRRA